MPSRFLVLCLSFAVAFGVIACTPAGSGPRTMAINMTDAMAFEPGSITVKLGETVNFDVHNSGEIAHEFFVGSAIAQDDHEIEMKQMGAMGHDHPTGVYVEAGASKMLAVRFDTAGTFMMGCHEPGHWAAGMQGMILVQP